MEPSKIVLGLGSGIAVGVFFGEEVSFLRILADAYVKLLQMTVLPYVVVSLIIGLGSLSYQQALLLAKKAGGVIVLLWLVALTMVFLIPLSFPASVSASFFSTSLLETSEPVDFLSLYIPSNPFHSLANNIVPAVVLFSVFVGVALIAVERKQILLDVLSVFSDAITRATRFVVSLTPYGIFAIAAVTAGTMSVEQLGRVQYGSAANTVRVAGG